VSQPDPAGSRRDQIVEATLRVIGARGADAVTHRAVAAEAGVSLALTTYHFASKQELVIEALERVIERSIETVRQHAEVTGPITPEQLAERLTALTVAQLEDDRAPLVVQYELMLEAARDDSLRPLAQRWSEAYEGSLVALVQAAGLADPELSAGILSAVIEGALLDHIAFPRPRFVEDRLQPMVSRAVAGLATPAAPPAREPAARS
jgi:TetR/AcrR family transcriptional regulator, regulator of biofilm formation and stress response